MQLIVTLDSYNESERARIKLDGVTVNLVVSPSKAWDGAHKFEIVPTAEAKPDESRNANSSFMVVNNGQAFGGTSSRRH